MKNESRSLC